ncbi:MAG: nuclear transport factor 2 family protein, partial [Dehalococcoidia bacterium]|nr:nuclear transport factor 2 family protein [Dehalococcoidia bacterium]
MSLEEQVTALQRQVDELQAGEAIRYTMAQYARCIDENRLDELQELFTEDATVQNLPWNQKPAEGRAMAMKAFRNY